MYWESFGFKEPPFALTPNPAFVFLSNPHQEAFAHLLFAIENRAGFIELSGEVGTGKTTIVRTLLNQLEPDTHRTALIFNPTLSPLGLLKEIVSEFGIGCGSDDLHDLHTALNGYLLEENRAGRTVVLVIDEAQNLAVEVLEQVRLISNLETDSAKLIQIVLVGQPELNELLAREELRQLDQRITVRYHLKPMSFADTGAYIRHRIRFAAEGREPLTFSKGALQRIYRFSGGLPRLINGACDRALLLAYTRECKEVSPEMARLAIADLRKEIPRRRRAVPMKSLAVAMAVCVLVVAGFSMLSGSLVPEKKAAVEDKQPAAPAPQLLNREEALKGLAALSEQENLLAAVNGVLAAWQAQPVRSEPGRPVTLKTLVRQRDLVATRLDGGLEELIRLDAPALLHVSLEGGEQRVVALLKLSNDSVRVVPDLGGKKTLSRAELAQVWTRGATVLWKDFHGLDGSAKPADKAAAVKALQGMLKQAGCFNGTATGLLGKATREALETFQRREGLAVDGKPGAQTLMFLYRRAGGFFPPGLAGEGVDGAQENQEGRS